MDKFSTSIGKLMILGIVIGLLAIMFLNTDRITSLRFIGGDIDRSDYAFVAENFISKSGFIANKIGKVTSVSHVGKGGASGGKSFNVFKVRGEERAAVCNLTVTRSPDGQWYVTSADIAYGGKNLKIPVKRSEGEILKTFKLK
ncbi:MAG TPA: hypothetical protein ENH82_04140 [bacterium]|nr:hypothetical protein [bacterium]